MIDFTVGWDLRQRLINDGFYSGEFDSSPELEVELVKLAKKHYNYKPPSPRNKSQFSNEYRESLEQHTPNDRLCYIYDIAIDWDGCRTVKGLGSLVDEIIECASIPTKSKHTIMEQFYAVLGCKSLDEFLKMYSQRPLIWAFPIEYCNELLTESNEDYSKVRYLCHHYDDKGKLIGMSFKIS